MMSTPQQALKDLEKKKIWPVYFLYGPEMFKIDEFISKIKELTKVTSLNLYDGAKLDVLELLDSLQSMSLFGALTSDFQVTVVKNSQHIKNADRLFEEILDAEGWKQKTKDHLLILVSESLDGRKKTHQWLKKNGFALEFKIAKDAELVQWIEYMAKKRKVGISKQATEFLAALSEGSLYVIENEIEKAFLFSEGAKIEVEHLSAVSALSGHYEMVELVQAILDRKKTRALLLAQRLIRTNDDALGLIGFLNWSLKSKLNTQNTGPTMWKSVQKMSGALLKCDQRLKSSALGSLEVIEDFIVGLA